MSERDATTPWPLSRGDDFGLTLGAQLLGDELNDSVISNTFVRCYDCQGRGCDSCGETGFDWSDTCDVRATLTEAMNRV